MDFCIEIQPKTCFFQFSRVKLNLLSSDKMDYIFYIDFKHVQANFEENPATACVLTDRSNLIFLSFLQKYRQKTCFFQFSRVKLNRLSSDKMDYIFYVDFKHDQSNSEENPATVCVLAVRSNLIFWGLSSVRADLRLHGCKPATDHNNFQTNGL